MLIELRVANFRSLRDEQALSLVADKDATLAESHTLEAAGSDGRLVRSAVLYGANASGKSNLVFALATLRELVLRGGQLSAEQFAEFHTPFALDAATTQAPTEIELTLLLGGVRHQYGIAFDRQRIVGEWLYVYETSRPQRWFVRRHDATSDQEVWEPFSTHLKGPRDTWRRATAPRATFLATAAQLNSEQLLPLKAWFESGLHIVAAGGAPDVAPTLLRLADPAFKTEVLGLLREADIQVADIQVQMRKEHIVQLAAAPGMPGAQVSVGVADVPHATFLHRARSGTLVAFDERFESLGTQRLIAFAGPILQAIARRSLLVIDEFDASLHPMLVRQLLALLHDPLQAQPGAQLLMTTHDTSLMDPALLRRDQIWFAEKGEDQATELVPLTDFSPRRHESFERSYLLGRYGALPRRTRAVLQVAA